MLNNAKSGFQEENDSRTQRRSGEYLQQSQMERQAMINQKNMVMNITGAQTNANLSKNSGKTGNEGNTKPDKDFEWNVEEFSEPEPVQATENPELAILSPMHALLKYGAKIYDQTSEFVQELNRAALQVFRSAAEPEIERLWAQNGAAAVSDLDNVKKYWRNLAIQMLPSVLSIAAQAAAFLRTAGVSEDWISNYLSTFNITTSGNDNEPLIRTSPVSTPFEPSGLGLSQERREAFISGKNKIVDSYSAAALVNTLGSKYWLISYFDNDEIGIQYHLEEMNWFSAEAQRLFGLQLPTNNSLVLRPSSVTYVDDLGNTSRSTIHHLNYGPYSYNKYYPQQVTDRVDSYTYNGLINSDMRQYLSHQSLGWWELQPNGSRAPLADRHADFSGLFREYPGYQVQFFQNVKCVKIIETGKATRWEFRDPATDDLLASVVIPGSEMNTENLNPINLQRNIKIIENYENGKLGLVTVTDLELNESIYIQKTKFSDSINYNPLTGEVYEGVVTNRLFGDRDYAFSYAMREGWLDENYFDDEFPWIDSPEITNGKFFENQLKSSNGSSNGNDQNAFYYVLPGFKGEVRENAAAESIRRFAEGLISNKVDRTQIRLIPLFERIGEFPAIIKDKDLWTDDATGYNEKLTSELIDKLQKKYPTSAADLSKRQVLVAYSGSLNPALKAIARSPALPVDAIISYGGPTRSLPDDFSKNPRFKTFINVWGSTDETKWFADKGMSGNIGPQDLSRAGIKTINIEIRNAGHFDFWYSDEKLAREPSLVLRNVNIKTSDFLKSLTKAAGDNDDLDTFLDRPGIEKKSDGTFVVHIEQIKLSKQ